MAVTKDFNSSDRSWSIGAVFTPLKWGKFAVEKFDLFSKWLNGATIFDPTLGEGHLLEALIEYGLSKGLAISDLPTYRLHGNELNTRYYIEALVKFKEKYGIDMRSNFTNEDLLDLKPFGYDIIFGNPPWQNFVDLPEDYKVRIKRYFFEYELVSNPKSLLLGGSRIDIAALIIQVAIKNFLRKGGEAVFFLPLSLFLNEGAHRNFRKFAVGHTYYSVQCVYDFNGEKVFEGVNTRYGVAHFAKDTRTTFPISYFQFHQSEWRRGLAKPLFHDTDPFSVFFPEDVGDPPAMEPIVLKKESMPRQGINTGGANEVFFFDALSSAGKDVVAVSNKSRRDIVLPEVFVYPLITSKQFKSGASLPGKWVLLPYRQDGRPLEWLQIEQFPELKKYLEENRTILQQRKGTLLNAALKRGYWWALLGVGEYCFFPYKVVWEAYGRTTFQPQIFEGRWQANQSLQAFIPVRTLAEAESIKAALSDSRIEQYLLSMKMNGTMNWAQPGKIKQLIRYENEMATLF